MADLIINNLDVIQRSRALIESLSHRFLAGSIAALTGDNGCGKSTLLRTIAGLHPLPSKRIFIGDHDICGLTPNMRACVISMLLQVSPLHPYCTVEQRIAHGLMPALGFSHMLDQNTLNQVKSIAHELCIDHLLYRRLASLSGGEQRLVHLAKCLINPHTKILLLDEPSVFLDFTQQDRLVRSLKQQKEQGRVVIFSSHDAAFIKRVSDHVVVIKDRALRAIDSDFLP